MLPVLERMGIELKAEAKPSAGLVTPQMLVQRTLEQEAAHIKQASGVELPSYYNAAAVNPQRLVDQIQKRKLLWGAKVCEIVFIQSYQNIVLPLSIILKKNFHLNCRRMILAKLSLNSNPLIINGKVLLLPKIKMAKWQQSSTDSWVLSSQFKVYFLSFKIPAYSVDCLSII